MVPLAVFSLRAGRSSPVRERSPGYAFAAGLVADVTLMGGYALAVVTGGGTLDAVQLAGSCNSANLGATLWAARAGCSPADGSSAWRETPAADFAPAAASARALMLLQTGMAAAAGDPYVLLVPAVLLLALPAAGRWVWTVEAGSPLGWAAAPWLAWRRPAPPRRQQARPRRVARDVPRHVHGCTGLTACTIELRASPGSGLPCPSYSAEAGAAALGAGAVSATTHALRGCQRDSLPGFEEATSVVPQLLAAPSSRQPRGGGPARLPGRLGRRRPGRRRRRDGPTAEGATAQTLLAGLGSNLAPPVDDPNSSNQNPGPLVYRPCSNSTPPSTPPQSLLWQGLRAPGGGLPRAACSPSRP